METPRDQLPAARGPGSRKSCLPDLTVGFTTPGVLPTYSVVNRIAEGGPDTLSEQERRCAVRPFNLLDISLTH